MGRGFTVDGVDTPITFMSDELFKHYIGGALFTSLRFNYSCLVCMDMCSCVSMCNIGILMLIFSEFMAVLYVYVVCGFSFFW